MYQNMQQNLTVTNETLVTFQNVGELCISSFVVFSLPKYFSTRGTTEEYFRIVDGFFRKRSQLDRHAPR